MCFILSLSRNQENTNVRTTVGKPQHCFRWKGGANKGSGVQNKKLEVFAQVPKIAQTLRRYRARNKQMLNLVTELQLRHMKRSSVRARKFEDKLG